MPGEPVRRLGAVADARARRAAASSPGPPDARWTDDDGVHHRLYRVREPGVIAAMRDAVAASPVVIADGHHRYSTSLAYKGERNEPGAPPDFVMAFIVELAPEQLQRPPDPPACSRVSIPVSTCSPRSSRGSSRSMPARSTARRRSPAADGRCRRARARATRRLLVAATPTEPRSTASTTSTRAGSKPPARAFGTPRDRVPARRRQRRRLG